MNPSAMLRRGVASAPGTCGELAQGMLNGVLCLVTCPVDIRSTATVELLPGDGKVEAPRDSPKATRAVQATLDFLNETGVDVRLSLESRLPRGKGMASSTADVAASIAATAVAAGRCLKPEQVAEIAVSVEPSDGIMFPGIVVFDHREGRIARALGQPPPMRVLVLDFGGVVDTLEFNRECNSDARNAALKSQGSRMSEAVSLIESGLIRGNPLHIGKGATISAIANQEVAFNPCLDDVLAFSAEVGAYGVNVAHSGTVVGVLLPDQPAAVAQASVLERGNALAAWNRRCNAGWKAVASGFTDRSSHLPGNEWPWPGVRCSRPLACPEHCLKVDQGLGNYLKTGPWRWN